MRVGRGIAIKYNRAVLLDELMPRFDFSERHQVTIDAPAEVVWSVLRTIDFGRLPISRFLMALRGMGALARRRARGAEERLMTLDSIGRYGFRLIGEREDEVVIGLLGKFWKLAGEVIDFEPQHFTEIDARDCAKAAWNFHTAAAGDRTALMTETRVLCPDEGARRRFGRYWVLIRPFSGLIRIEMIRAVKRRAERAKR